MAEASQRLPGSGRRLGFHGAGGTRVPQPDGASSRSPSVLTYLPARSAPGLKTGAGRGGEGTRETAHPPPGWGRAGDRGRGPEEAEGGVETVKEDSLLGTAERGGCPEWRRDKRKPGGVTAEREAQDRTDRPQGPPGWRVSSACPGGRPHCPAALGCPRGSDPIQEDPISPAHPTPPPVPPVSPFPHSETLWVWGRVLYTLY